MQNCLWIRNWTLVIMNEPSAMRGATPNAIFDNNANVFAWLSCYQILTDWVQSVQLMLVQIFSLSFLRRNPSLCHPTNRLNRGCWKFSSIFSSVSYILMLFQIHWFWTTNWSQVINGSTALRVLVATLVLLASFLFVGAVFISAFCIFCFGDSRKKAESLKRAHENYL